MLLSELWLLIADQGLHQKSNSLLLEAQSSRKGVHTASPEMPRIARATDFQDAVSSFFPVTTEGQNKEFSLSSKKLLRVPTSQSVQLYTLLYCFAFDSRDVPGICLARTQSQAWTACRGGTDRRSFKAGSGKSALSPFSATLRGLSTRRGWQKASLDTPHIAVEDADTLDSPAE